MFVEEPKVLTGYIIQVGDRYYSGYGSEYGQAYFLPCINDAEVVLEREGLRSGDIDGFATHMRRDADPQDLGENQEIRIHKCQVAILD